MIAGPKANVVDSSDSIVPVPIGQMRNYYYPRRIAEYVTMTEARDIKRNNVTVERDVLFGRVVAETSSERVKAAARKAREPEKIDIQMMAVSKSGCFP